MPDRGGEGEEAGGDAGVDAGQSAAAVLLEGELAFEGVEDCLDPLPLAGELPEPGCLVFAVGADQVRSQLAGDELLEVFPGEALVAEDDLPAADQLVVAFQQGAGDLALAVGRGGPGPR